MRAQDPYGGRSGHSLPDPASAWTVQEFVTNLRQLKLWAGDPSFEALRRRCGVPSSTLADAVRPNRTRLPRLEVVRQFVHACGATAADVAGWEAGWRRVRERQDASARQACPLERSVAPHQLPAAVSPLTGRDTMLDQLDLLHRERPGRAPRSRLTLIVGPAGVGKTALAVHWAHRSVPDYPGGQLYLDLLGAATRPAVSPGEALHFLLAALGVPPDDAPAELGARIGLYRSLTYSRRLLIVLDNARDAEHVRPLLPGGPDCTTLVTSRNRLSALVAGEGGVRLRLAPLRTEEAVCLIASMLGESRAAREPEAVRDLARLGGCLPLALRIAAANLADHPYWMVAEYAAQLAAGNRLTQLALEGDETTAVRAAFDISYAALPGPARWVFRRLAFAPAPEFTIDDAVAVTGRPPAEVYRRIETLVAAHLVEPTAPGRYCIHDLLKLYAADLANEEARARLAAS